MKRSLWVITLGLLATLLVGCGAGSVSRPEDVQRISPEDAKALLDEGRAVLYDTRSAAAHQSQRAAGAISFPEADAAARIDELPDDGTAIILYCTWPAEEQSARVALQMIDAGQNPENVYALRGGLAAWHEAGYPLASGAD